MLSSRASLAAAIGATAGVVALAGCSAGAGGAAAGARASNTVRVLMVNNPQMVDLQKLTAANFTKETGIKVNFTVAAGERRARQDQPGRSPTRPASTTSPRVSNYEIPFYAKNGWLHALDDYVRQGRRRSTRPTSSSR